MSANIKSYVAFFAIVIGIIFISASRAHADLTPEEREARLYEWVTVVTMEVKDCKTKWIRTTCFGAAFIVGGFGSNPVGAAFGILGLLVEQTEETHCICAEGRGCSDAIVNMQEIIDAQNRGDIFVPTPVYEVRCVRYWKSLLGSTCAESRICDQCN